MKKVKVVLKTRGAESLIRHMNQHQCKRIGKPELNKNKENYIKPLIWQPTLQGEILGK
jgi:hypothetical protein